jgi:hypothetical protein
VDGDQFLGVQGALGRLGVGDGAADGNNPSWVREEVEVGC